MLIGPYPRRSRWILNPVCTEGQYRRPQLRPLGLYLCFIKRLGRNADRLTPDRSAMTMDRVFLAAYSFRLIATCHHRGALAMGGMSAFIPVKRCRGR